MLKIFILLMAWLAPALTQAAFCKVYYLSSGYNVIFDGMGRDHEGNVFVGAGKHAAIGAALFKYDPAKDQLLLLGNVETASRNVNNWLTDDLPGKIHTKIHEYPDGRIFFATHSQSESTDYSFFRGAHLYSWTPGAAGLKDESAPGVLIPHEGALDIALAPNQGIIYGIGYPDGDVYGHDLRTGQSRFLFKCGPKSGAISRYVFTDNAGRLYYPQGTMFMCYEPDSSRVSYRGRGMSGVFQISALIKTLSGDTVYFINHGGYHLYRYIVSMDLSSDLGPANPDGGATSIQTLALRYDLGRLYYAPDQTGQLVEFNLATGKAASYAAIPVDRYTGSNGVDGNGDILFSEMGTGSGKVYKFDIPEPCGVCGGVNKEDSPGRTRSTSLLQITPNPFVPGQTLRVHADGALMGRFSIHDINGRKIADMKGDRGNATWKTRGVITSPGMYLLQMRLPGKTVVQPLFAIN